MYLVLRRERADSITDYLRRERQDSITDCEFLLFVFSFHDVVPNIVLYIFTSCSLAKADGLPHA